MGVPSLDITFQNAAVLARYNDLYHQHKTPILEVYRRNYLVITSYQTTGVIEALSVLVKKITYAVGSAFGFIRSDAHRILELTRAVEAACWNRLNPQFQQELSVVTGQRDAIRAELNMLAQQEQGLRGAVVSAQNTIAQAEECHKRLGTLHQEIVHRTSVRDSIPELQETAKGLSDFIETLQRQKIGVQREYDDLVGSRDRIQHSFASIQGAFKEAQRTIELRDEAQRILETLKGEVQRLEKVRDSIPGLEGRSQELSLQIQEKTVQIQRQTEALKQLQEDLVQADYARRIPGLQEQIRTLQSSVKTLEGQLKTARKSQRDLETTLDTERSRNGELERARFSHSSQLTLLQQEKIHLGLEVSELRRKLRATEAEKDQMQAAMGKLNVELQKLKSQGAAVSPLGREAQGLSGSNPRISALGQQAKQIGNNLN